MNNIFIGCLLLVMLCAFTGKANVCENFNTNNPSAIQINTSPNSVLLLDNWSTHCANLAYTDIGSRNGSGDVYLRSFDNGCTGISSWTFNGVDYTGDWTDINDIGSLCYDYILFNNGNNSPPPSTNIVIYAGTSPVTATLMAEFKLNVVPTEFDGWQTICPPIGSSTSLGLPPSNADGYWEMTVGSDWDGLINNVSGIAFNQEIGSSPTEVYGYDNICVSLQPDPCEGLTMTQEQTQGQAGCCHSLSLTNNSTTPFAGLRIEAEAGLTMNYTLDPASGLSVLNFGPDFVTLFNQSGAMPTGDLDDFISICLENYFSTTQEVTLTWFDENFEPSCIDTLSFNCSLTPENCAFLVDPVLGCNADGSHSYTFSLENASGNDLNSVTFSNLTAGITVTPSPATIPTTPNGSTSSPQEVTISGAAAVSGATVCWNISLHEYATDGTVLFCCTPDSTYCVTLPDCGNSPPFGNPDSVVTNEDTPIKIDVLTNDSDPDGNIDAGSLTVIDLPVNGMVIVNPDGTITYIPDADYNGMDSFTYEICDDYIIPNCVTVPVTITVLPINDRPVAQDDMAVTTEDTPVIISVLANDSDSDGNIDPATVTIIDAPGNGFVAVAADGSITYTPDVNSSGTVTFTYQVCDEGTPLPAECDDALVTITIPACPTADAGPDQTICISGAIVLGGAAEPGASYIWTPGDGLSSPFVANPVATPQITTTYTLFVVTADCSRMDEVTVTVDETSVPFAEAGMDQAICEGDAVTIGGNPTTTATGPDVLVAWTSTGDPAAISDPTVLNPIVNPISPATFMVCVTNLGCTKCDTMEVYVNPQPDIDAGPDVEACIGNPVFIGGSPTAALDAIIQWTPESDLDNPSAQNPFASPAVTTTYTVAVTRGGCTVTDQVTVNVIECRTVIAIDDFYETDEETVLTVPDLLSPVVGILDNDYDSDGGAISIAGATPSLTIISTVDPVNSININSDGSFVYSPGPGFNGTDSFEYEVCNMDVPLTCDIGVIYIVVNPCVDIQLAVWLEGPYRDVLGPQGMMSTFMNLSAGQFNPLYRGVLPGQKKVAFGLPGIVITEPFQPYDDVPWNYNGTEGQSDAPPWYYAPGSTDPMGDPDFAVYHPDVVDWVLVRFRTGTILPTDQTVVEKTAAALLFNDGTIRFLEDCVLKSGGLSSNVVYAQIDHRNHMAVMTPIPVDISNDQFFWDFRIQDSFETPTSFGQKEVEPGVWVMYAGDADQVNDMPNYDITGGDNILWGALNGNFDQYLEGDYELNGDVTGDDKILWSINNGISNRVPDQ